MESREDFAATVFRSGVFLVPSLILAGIFLIGLNDMGATLSFARGPTQGAFEVNATQFRNQVLNGGRRLRPSLPYFKRTALFELAKRSSAVLLERFSPSAELGWLGVGPGSYMAENGNSGLRLRQWRYRTFK